MNEADRIAPTIRAALEVADEVIVVDSGSTDETVALAEAQGARVVHQPWLGNGFQKCVGQGQCRNDWVLDIDADEVLSPELIDSIRRLFAEGRPTANGYLLKVAFVPPFGAPWLDFALARRLKLYDRRHFSPPAHKAWDQPEIPKSERTPALDGVILHRSFRDLTDLHGKLNRVSRTRAFEGKRRSLASLRLRIVFGMPFYFFKSYVLRGMWRGGMYGFVIALSFAYARWQTAAKAYEAQRIAGEVEKTSRRE